ncbi:MAG: pitrilysin family protein [Pseudomonadota bacterium]|nr:pitrilysin family protein [Pseudomonadota bacterium]
MVKYRKSILANGIRVLSEAHAQSQVLSLSIWIDAGSSDEEKKFSGMAHLIEHMVFKGTKKYSAYNLVANLEAVGADINAFTSRENTCFHTLSLGEHMDLALDVLSELVNRAEFPKEEFDKERQVVTQELRMGQDSPEEHIFDMFFEKAYPNLAVGQPITGTMKSLKSITRDKLIKYYRKRYVGDNMYVIAIGAVDHDKLVKKVDALLGGLPKGEKTQKPMVSSLIPFAKVVDRDLEHVHVLFGLPAPHFLDPWRIEGAIVSSIVGGGMASRLYQEVREKQALVYSIYTYQHTQFDTGVEFIYSSTEPKRVKKLLTCLFDQIDRLRTDGISKKEIEMAKTQLRGQILLAAEEHDFRMGSLAVGEMLFGSYRSIENIIDEVEAVKPRRVNDYVQKFWDPEKMGIMLLGPVEENRTIDLISKLMAKMTKTTKTTK